MMKLLGLCAGCCRFAALNDYCSAPIALSFRRINFSSARSSSTRWLLHNFGQRYCIFNDYWRMPPVRVASHNIKGTRLRQCFAASNSAITNGAGRLPTRCQYGADFFHASPMSWLFNFSTNAFTITQFRPSTVIHRGSIFSDNHAFNSEGRW